MKKRAFMLVGILLISIVMSACSSNSKSTTNENETTIIQAEYPVYDTAEEIVDASDLVFSGTVTEINYESLNVKSETGADSETGLVEATEIPYTIFDISIEKVYKGNVESSSISIKRPGGKIDGQFFVVEGASTIEVGETYLFITQTYENAYPSLLNVTQASFDMSKPEVLNSEQGNARITLSEVLVLVALVIVKVSLDVSVTGLLTASSDPLTSHDLLSVVVVSVTLTVAPVGIPSKAAVWSHFNLKLPSASV